MNNKPKISICLFACILFLSNPQILHGKQTDLKTCEPTAKSKDDSVWSRMIASIVATFSTKKPEAISETKKVHVAAKKPVKNISREQAIESMKQVTTKLFDPTDVNHITLHLSKMKELAKFLDEIEDKKTIAAIHFLLENQHRSSILDLKFWSDAVKRLELDVVIPMTIEVSKKTQAEKLVTLRKKMTIGN